MNEPELIRSMLAAKTIAVIGLSDRPDRPSHYVSAYLQQQGYKIYPVNPTLTEVLGEKSYPSLTDLPLKPDLVNVFRVPSLIPAIVDVVMDHCLMMEHRAAHP